jgi:hypothetical protein
MIYDEVTEVRTDMRRLLQKTLSMALAGMLLGTPVMLLAQGKKKGGGHGGARSGGRKRSGARKKGGGS